MNRQNNSNSERDPGNVLQLFAKVSNQESTADTGLLENCNNSLTNQPLVKTCIKSSPGISAVLQQTASGIIGIGVNQCSSVGNLDICMFRKCFNFPQRPGFNFAQRPGIQNYQQLRFPAVLCLWLLLLVISALPEPVMAAEWDRLTIPRVKYDGGGDWYVGPTSMPNMLKQAGERLQLPVQSENVAVSISDPELFRYPMLFLTGHGQVRFKDHEINTLLVYLDNGGFLWVNDSYGIDKFIRREIRRLYPDRELLLLPADHPIFNTVYEFKEGLPKIHEHDGKPPAAWALFDKGRMKILYTYESDIGDGLEDAGVHPNDTPEIREKAMQMAMNILVYVMMQ